MQLTLYSISGELQKPQDLHTVRYILDIGVLLVLSKTTSNILIKQIGPVKLRICRG